MDIAPNQRGKKSERPLAGSRVLLLIEVCTDTYYSCRSTEAKQRRNGQRKRCVLSLLSVDHSRLVFIDPICHVLSFAIRRHLLGIFVDGFQATLFALTGGFLVIVVRDHVLRLFEVILKFDLTDRTATGWRPRMRLQGVFTR